MLTRLNKSKWLKRKQFGEILLYKTQNSTSVGVLCYGTTQCWDRQNNMAAVFKQMPGREKVMENWSFVVVFNENTPKKGAKWRWWTMLQELKSFTQVTNVLALQISIFQTGFPNIFICKQNSQNCWFLSRNFWTLLHFTL